MSTLTCAIVSRISGQDSLCTATPTHRKDISMIVNETSSKIVSPAKIESFI